MESMSDASRPTKRLKISCTECTLTVLVDSFDDIRPKLVDAAKEAELTLPENFVLCLPPHELTSDHWPTLPDSRIGTVDLSLEECTDVPRPLHTPDASITVMPHLPVQTRICSEEALCMTRDAALAATCGLDRMYMLEVNGCSAQISSSGGGNIAFGCVGQLRLSYMATERSTVPPPQLTGTLLGQLVQIAPTAEPQVSPASVIVGMCEDHRPALEFEVPLDSPGRAALLTLHDEMLRQQSA